MKSIFLLILSLITGIEASTEIKICPKGWLEMTWKCPCDEQKHNKLKVILPNETIQSNQTDKWEKSGKYYFFHDTSKKHLRLIFWSFNSTDNGTYVFNYNENTKKREVEIAEVKDCKKLLKQTAYRTAKMTIKCDYPDMHLSKIKFICKKNKFTCKSILTTISSNNSKGRFSLIHTSRGFHLSISPVILKDAGVYWCGVKESNGSYQAGISKIQLEVKNITVLPRSKIPGQDFKYYCKYRNGNYSNLTKFICKGENPNECQDVGSTTKNNMSRRFMMKDNNINQTITIEVRNVTAADSGTYWCGAENANKKHSKIFIHKLNLKVATLPANTFGDIKKYLITGTVVVILLLSTTLIIINKRRLNTKNTERRAAECHPTEEHFYEDVPEHQETLVAAIYANIPTNEPNLLPYAIVSFQKT